MPLPADYVIIVRQGLYVSFQAMETIRKSGPRSKYHDAGLISVAITDHCISRYRNLKRPGFEEAYCYICSPSYRYNGNGKQVSCEPDRLFIVYALPGQMYGSVVFDWEWRRGNQSSGELFDGQVFGEKIDEPNS